MLWMSVFRKGKVPIWKISECRLGNLIHIEVGRALTPYRRSYCEAMLVRENRCVVYAKHDMYADSGDVQVSMLYDSQNGSSCDNGTPAFSNIFFVNSLLPCAVMWFSCSENCSGSAFAASIHPFSCLSISVASLVCS